MTINAMKAIPPMTIAAMAPTGRLGVDDTFAGAEAVGAEGGAEDEFDRKRERTSPFVHCIDELEFLR